MRDTIVAFINEWLPTIIAIATYVGGILTVFGKFKHVDKIEDVDKSIKRLGHKVSNLGNKVEELSSRVESYDRKRRGVRDDK